MHRVKNDKIKAEYAKRSPITYFNANAKLPKLDLNIGFKDRDVPVNQGIKLFNKMAEGKEIITKDELNSLQKHTVPANLKYKSRHNYQTYKGKYKKLLVRKDIGKVRLNIFNGHHEFCPADTFKWFNSQKKK